MTQTDPAPQPVDTPAPPGKKRTWGRIVVMLIGIPLLVLGAGYVAYQIFKPHIYHGTVMQAPTRAPEMEGLVFADGTPVDMGDFRGDVVLIYFGYTHCPDVCPTTLNKAALARDQVGDDDRVHVMMVSVDPERDDLESLGEYVTSFGDDFLGATGDISDIERVATEYGVFFARGDDTDTGYDVDHTASLLGIDTDGRLRIVWPTAVTVDDLAADIDELL
jgi:protein SCO1/2